MGELRGIAAAWASDCVRKNGESGEACRGAPSTMIECWRERIGQTVDFQVVDVGMLGTRDFSPTPWEKSAEAHVCVHVNDSNSMRLKFPSLPVIAKSKLKMASLSSCQSLLIQSRPLHVVPSATLVQRIHLYTSERLTESIS
jgi:hypothetical protein